jgi:hypothetical protein
MCKGFYYVSYLQHKELSTPSTRGVDLVVVGFAGPLVRRLTGAFIHLHHFDPDQRSKLKSGNTQAAMLRFNQVRCTLQSGQLSD